METNLWFQVQVVLF